MTVAEEHFYSGIFTEIAGDVGDEIEASEARVLTRPPPEWLRRLVRIWNGIGASVITFNYDTLIEHAATYVAPTGDRWPGVSFKLLKVHGSSDWWRPRGDPTGMTVELRPLSGWGASSLALEPQGERVLIPPIAAKNPFYDLNIIRGEWESARVALENAARLFIVGYRLPDTDLAATSLVSEHLAPNANVTLVNLRPDGPAAVLKRIGRLPSRTITGSRCIREAFMAEYERIVGKDLMPIFVESMQAMRKDVPVLARIDDNPGTQAIRAIGVRGKRLILTTTGRALEDSDWRTALTTRRLRRALLQVKSAGGFVVIRCGHIDHLALAIRGPLEYGARQWTAVEG